MILAGDEDPSKEIEAPQPIDRTEPPVIQNPSPLGDLEAQSATSAAHNQNPGLSSVQPAQIPVKEPTDGEKKKTNPNPKIKLNGPLTAKTSPIRQTATGRKKIQKSPSWKGMSSKKRNLLALFQKRKAVEVPLLTLMSLFSLFMRSFFY